jgi:3,4-dihydroxy 2-butanone 4-phosphate synthase/GTP cyclohydrolase II
MKLNTVEELIEDIRQGRMVIIMDDEDRENEGDLVMAASLTRPQDINFMAMHGRGLICLTLTRERCQQLRLPLMVRDNQASHGTNFTASIEAAEGVTTGISAADRARTIQAAVAKEARPEDLVQPGHIFPLMASAGGVLARAGHTEAGCDLARLAGLEPAGTIVEILNPDGSMARRPDLEKFAAEHNLKIGTIEDLIRYRIQNERTIERIAETEFPTHHGHFHLYAYSDLIENGLHLALVKGQIDPDQPIPVRVHVENMLCDTLSAQFGCGWPLQDAMRRIADMDFGVVVILRQPEDQGALVRQIQQYQLAGGCPSPTPRSEDAGPQDQRTFGIGAQILSDLGVRQMRLMSAPKIFHGLAGFNLEVVDYITE